MLSNQHSFVRKLAAEDHFPDGHEVLFWSRCDTCCRKMELQNDGFTFAHAIETKAKHFSSKEKYQN